MGCKCLPLAGYSINKLTVVVGLLDLVGVRGMDQAIDRLPGEIVRSVVEEVRHPAIIGVKTPASNTNLTVTYLASQ